MIEIVAGHSFDQHLECHLTSLRMREWLGKRGGWNRLDQRDIPFADGSKYVHRGARLESVIAGGPLVLVEGLYHVMRFGQRLPQTERKGQLGIRQMTQNLWGTPLSRS